MSLVLIYAFACCSCVSLMYCVHSDLAATVRPQFLPVMLLLQLMAMHPACIHGHSSLDASGESLVPSGPAENNNRTHALSRFTLCVRGQPISPLSPLIHGRAPRRCATRLAGRGWLAKHALPWPRDRTAGRIVVAAILCIHASSSGQRLTSKGNG